MIEKVKSVDSLPTDIENKIWERKQEEFLDVFMDDNYLYLAVGLGEKSTGGYEINIREINTNNLEEWKVILDKKTPEKNKVLAQAITYPMAIGKIILKDKKIPKKITFHNKKGGVIKKVSMNTKIQE